MEEFADFYAAHVRGLTVQLFAYTNDLPHAQDVVHEAFCRAVARWSTLRAYDDPAAWVRRVAYNLANSRWRRDRVARAFSRRHRETYLEGPSPDRVALARALAAIAPNHRRAIVLHYLADLSVADIAAQEEMAEGTVKAWLSKGRAALAAQLTDPKEARHV